MDGSGKGVGDGKWGLRRGQRVEEEVVEDDEEEEGDSGREGG